MADVNRHVIADDFSFYFNRHVSISIVVFVTSEIVRIYLKSFMEAMYLCAFISCSRVATYKEKEESRN